MPATKSFTLASHSFLRRVDPRTKLLLSLAASAAIMLPLYPLAIFALAHLALVLAAGLGRRALRQLVPVAPLLALLFVVDWIFVGLPLAVLISLRLVLLVTAFTLLFATTTADELRLALEGAHLPRRAAFALATACCALPLLESEWQAIREAQQARGIYDTKPPGRSWRRWRERLTSTVALIVPAIVMVTQRAWSIHETAAVRGFDSPARRAYARARLSRLDWLLLGGVALVLLGVLSTR
jgi:biotin transport system permease protein